MEAVFSPARARRSAERAEVRTSLRRPCRVGAFHVEVGNRHHSITASALRKLPVTGVLRIVAALER